MRDCMKNTLPYVSVVVPVLNAENNIGSLIDSLLSQDYPKESIQVVIVDNNSTDNTKCIAKHYAVTVLEENSIQSSYAARNKGIASSTGEIIAFIDSDCIAMPGWIREGVSSLITTPADLVAGKVEFYYSSECTVAEIYDSITHLQVNSSVKYLNIAPTSNLFVRSKLFGKIGMFPNLKSGGDGIWTHKATKTGFKLIYAPNAVVRHPARKFKELLRKEYRIGSNLPRFWIRIDSSVPKVVFRTGALFLPQKPHYIKKYIAQAKTAKVKPKVCKMFWIAYAGKLAMAMGVLACFWKFIFGQKKRGHSRKTQ